MFLHLTNVLTADEVAQARTLLGESAPWHDGQASASGGAQAQKRNAQLDPDSPQAQQLRALVLAAVQRDPLMGGAVLELMRHAHDLLTYWLAEEAPEHDPHVITVDAEPLLT